MPDGERHSSCARRRSPRSVCTARWPPSPPDELRLTTERGHACPSSASRRWRSSATRRRACGRSFSVGIWWLTADRRWCRFFARVLTHDDVRIVRTGGGIRSSCSGRREPVVLMIRTLHSQPSRGLKPVFLLDDDAAKHGTLRASWTNEQVEVRSIAIDANDLLSDATLHVPRASCSILPPESHRPARSPDRVVWRRKIVRRRESCATRDGARSHSESLPDPTPSPADAFHAGGRRALRADRYSRRSKTADDRRSQPSSRRRIRATGARHVRRGRRRASGGRSVARADPGEAAPHRVRHRRDAGRRLGEAASPDRALRRRVLASFDHSRISSASAASASRRRTSAASSASKSVSSCSLPGPFASPSASSTVIVDCHLAAFVHLARSGAARAPHQARFTRLGRLLADAPRPRNGQPLPRGEVPQRCTATAKSASCARSSKTIRS